MRRVLLVAVALSALSVTACATTMTVSSHAGRDLDIGRYRTYDWGPADALPTGDPRLDKSPFFQDHLEGAVEKQLAARGFERSVSGTPDLLIHYHASISRRLDVSGVDRGYGHSDGVDGQAQVFSYEAGTLILDIVDTRTNAVVWRGWAQDRLEGVLDNPDRMARQIDEAVLRMMARLRPIAHGR